MSFMFYFAVGLSLDVILLLLCKVLIFLLFISNNLLCLNPFILYPIFYNKIILLSKINFCLNEVTI